MPEGVTNPANISVANLAPASPAAPTPPPVPTGPPASAAPPPDADESQFLGQLQAMLDADTGAEILPDPSSQVRSPSNAASPAAAASPASAPSTVPASPVVQPQPATPPISDAMIDRARSAGISPEEARAYDPATLERTVAIFERNWNAVAAHMAAQRTPATPAAPPAAAPTPGQPAAPAAPAALPNEFQVTLDERLYDPETVKTIKDMNAFYAAKVKALEDKIGKVDQIEPLVATLARSEAQKSQREIVSNVETWVDSLGDDYKEILGTTPLSKLAPGSPERTEYAKIGETMDMLDAGSKAVGKPLSTKDAFDSAIRLLYGDRAAEKARARAAEEVANRLRDQRGRFIQRPSEIRQPDVQDPEVLAIADIRDILRREEPANGRY